MGSQLGEDFKKFGLRMIKYIKTTWMGKLYHIQDWNFFDHNSINIPATNNNNESENHRLNTKWLNFPQMYVFALQVLEEFKLLVGVKLPDLRAGKNMEKNKAKKSEQKLKNEEQERAKSILGGKIDEENKNTQYAREALDEYMGNMGAHGVKMGQQKFDSDFGAGIRPEDLSEDEDWSF